MEEYKRLRGHPGITGGTFDPVFLQDKILYLLAQDKRDYLPILKLEMPRVAAETDKLVIKKKDFVALRDFLSHTKSKLGVGWVVKASNSNR